jgi:hypothetical protein
MSNLNKRILKWFLKEVAACNIRSNSQYSSNHTVSLAAAWTAVSHSLNSHPSILLLLEAVLQVRFKEECINIMAHNQNLLRLLPMRQMFMMAHLL